MEPQIGILLATYNGARYLREQINSIQNQTHTNWVLYIRDDGSNDGTRDLLRELANNDSRLVIVSDALGNLGYNENFLQLLRISTQALVAFCDQDDVWLPEKLKLLSAPLLHHAGRSATPALSHCDSQVVDQDMQLIRATFIGQRGHKAGLDGILFANTVQGCSMMINRALANLALTVTPPLLPYDWHIALIGCMTGTRYYEPRPLAKYRQHGSNAVGANINTPNQKKATSSFQLSLAPYETMRKLAPQISISEHELSAVDDYFYFMDGPWGARKLSILLRRRYRMSRIKDTAKLFLLTITGRDLRRF